MNDVTEATMDVAVTEAASTATITLMDFIRGYGKGLLQVVGQQNPPVYSSVRADQRRAAVMAGMRRQPFPQQADAVQALACLLLDQDERAAVLNAEMGTGKTQMAIALSAVMHAEGAKRFLVLSPPHLVYKWKREIELACQGARVTVLNGPDALRKLGKLRQQLRTRTLVNDGQPEFYVVGRVRMRLGFFWKPAAAKRTLRTRSIEGDLMTVQAAACPRCLTVVHDDESLPVAHAEFLRCDERRSCCSHCGEPLWTLQHKPDGRKLSQVDLVRQGLCQLPTIGPKRADALIKQFGAERLGQQLTDNVYQFVNLMGPDGEFVFSDRQAKRLERGLAKAEFEWGQGSFQVSEFLKRYLPQGFFDLCIVDEGHEYKNYGSAQGQAMAVIAAKCAKVLVLTGTLMGGYSSDLFYLLFRIMPQRMIEDGFGFSRSGSLAAAAFAFAREYGVQKDIITTREDGGASHRTARGTRTSTRTVEAPGFGPVGVWRYVLPYTVFLKLKDLGTGILPIYEERYHEVGMDAPMEAAYRRLAGTLETELRAALARKDKTLLGVVLNCLLAWPECCFRPEHVLHPRTRSTLAFVPAVLGEQPSAKEEALIDIVLEAKAQGRKTLIYSPYTGTRDVTARLKALLEARGVKAVVLKATVAPDQREDWIAEQLERGCEALICNPELVKTGLDLLEFPEIVFLGTGYNVYTVQQAARRSWRIGQTERVVVHFLGYVLVPAMDGEPAQGTAQTACLRLMARKIAVSQSTSGEMPDSGLDALNADDGDSMEVELAKVLLNRQVN